MDPFARAHTFVKSLSPGVEAPQDPGLYVGRQLLNKDELQDWWAQVRLPHHPEQIDPNPHLTVAHSSVSPTRGVTPDPVPVTVLPEQVSGVSTLGNAVVLAFSSPDLVRRWQEYGAAGTHWDFDAYKPHLTLFYLPEGSAGPGWSEGQPSPPVFPLHFGGEQSGPLDGDVFNKALSGHAVPGDHPTEPWQMTRQEFESKVPVNSFDDVHHEKPVTIRGWHGSSAWDSIETEGFKLKDDRAHGLPANQMAKMHARKAESRWDQAQLMGDGIYFADSKNEAEKYGHAERVDVTLRKPYVIPKGYIDDFRRLSPSDLRSKGYDGVVVQSGRYGINDGENYRQAVAFNPSAVRISDEQKDAQGRMMRGAKVRHLGTGETGTIRAFRPSRVFATDQDGTPLRSKALSEVRWNGKKGVSTPRTSLNEEPENLHLIGGHRDHVEVALKVGKPVPPHVLADYPDMAKGMFSDIQVPRGAIPSLYKVSTVLKEPVGAVARRVAGKNVPYTDHYIDRLPQTAAAITHGDDVDQQLARDNHVNMLRGAMSNRKRNGNGGTPSVPTAPSIHAWLSNDPATVALHYLSAAKGHGAKAQSALKSDFTGLANIGFPNPHVNRLHPHMDLGSFTRLGDAAYGHIHSLAGLDHTSLSPTAQQGYFDSERSLGLRGAPVDPGA